MLRSTIVVSVVAILLSLGLVGCGLASIFAEATPTPTPTPTATPTPTVTPTPSPVPREQLGEISDFQVGLNGLSIEGSFKMGDDPVTFAYRPNQVGADEAGLRLNGTITYDFLGRADGAIELAALLRPVDDTCDKIGVTTEPLEFPKLELTIPSQEWEIDLTLLEGTSGSVPAEMICQATRLVIEQAESPLTAFLIAQINQLLKN